MKITTDSFGFHIAFKVPNDQTDRMETFLNTHESFMKETHHLEGNIEPVVLFLKWQIKHLKSQCCRDHLHMLGHFQIKIRQQSF